MNDGIDTLYNTPEVAVPFVKPELKGGTGLFEFCMAATPPVRGDLGGEGLSSEITAGLGG